MNLRIIFLIWVALITACYSFAGQSAPTKPPVGIPADAKLFNGKWYRVYLEQNTWTSARDKCRSLGGQLVVVQDELTHAFVKQLMPDVGLWLGATDEKIEGLWVWSDGKPMTFKAWFPGEPARGRDENFLFIINGTWQDHSNGRPQVVGFICEWRQR